MTERARWMTLLRGNSLPFNQAQEKLPYDAYVRLDGVDLRGIDLRGKWLSKFSLDGAMFDNAEHLEIAHHWGAIVKDPRFDGGPVHPPTHRVTTPTRTEAISAPQPFRKAA